MVLIRMYGLYEIKWILKGIWKKIGSPKPTVYTTLNSHIYIYFWSSGKGYLSPKKETLWMGSKNPILEFVLQKYQVL